MPRIIQHSPFEGDTSNPTSNRNETTAPKNGEWVNTFLVSVMQGMSVTDATKVAGVHITLPYKRRIDNEEFKRAWSEAAEIGTEFLEQEAARRAYHGVLEPVFYKGVECGYIRKYSDPLLMFLLKGRKPEVYRESVEEGSQRGNFTLNVSVVNTEINEARPSLEEIPAPSINVVVVNDSNQ